MSTKLTPELQTRADMQRAREQTTLDVGLVRDFVHGNQNEWENHDRIVKIMSKEPVFDKSKKPFMTRSQRFKNSLRMVHRLHELSDEHNWTRAQLWLGISLTDEPASIHLHFAAFEPVIESQATGRLLEEYGKLVANRGVIGCYLQTELGHGSNVASLETTASYIPETKEFEINSPTFTSSKWWVGSAAKLATHGVLQARLILPSGQDVGPHLFFIQLRSLEDHHTLPGITIGDIGPKAMGGWATTDNGFARFNHVRIPAYFMLSKFSQVTDDGRYIQPPHAKISYGGMLYIRSTMVTSAAWSTAKASTIALRYATVRRQGTTGPDGLETQIIHYPSVYNRLLPILARTYAFLLLGRNLDKAFASMNAKLAAGDTSLLAEMHAVTSGLKALVSTSTAQDIETARRCLGGHGFSEFTGLGRLYATYLPSTTFEGDNFLLDLQVVRAAVKAYTRFATTHDATTLTPSTAYLRSLASSTPPTSPPSTLDWSDPRVAVHVLELRGAFVARDYAAHAGDPDASAAQRVSRAVSEAFVAGQMGNYIQELKTLLPEREAGVIRDVLILYLLTTVESALVDVLAFGILPAVREGEDPARSLRKAVQGFCLKLIPHAIGLTDAFGFSDWELDSALGVADGSVYQTLWDKAQTEPLNKSDVVDGYEEHIKPILKRGQRLAGLGAKL